MSNIKVDAISTQQNILWSTHKIVYRRKKALPGNKKIELELFELFRL